MNRVKEDAKFIELSSNLSIAFYNAGIEEEYLYNIDKAWMNYENALLTSTENLGLGHNLTMKIRTSLQSFKKEKSEYFKEK